MTRRGSALGWGLAVVGWALALWVLLGADAPPDVSHLERQIASQKDENSALRREVESLRTAEAPRLASRPPSESPAATPSSASETEATPVASDSPRAATLAFSDFAELTAYAGSRNRRTNTPGLVAANAFSLPDDSASLSQVAGDARESAERRLAALLLLSTFDAPEAVRATERLFEDRDPDTRPVVDQVLDGTSDPAFLPLRARRDRERSPDARPSPDTVARGKDRPWSPLQATGEPDTPTDGDHPTAWASRQGDMGRVWLVLGYADAVRPDLVVVRESFNPGAVVEIAARAPDGTWEVLWSGVATPGSAPRDFAPALRSVSWRTSEIRLVLDTDRVRGWNEIDAVALEEDGRRQWATSAKASSSYSNSW